MVTRHLLEIAGGDNLMGDELGLEVRFVDLNRRFHIPGLRQVLLSRCGMTQLARQIFRPDRIRALGKT